MESMEPRRANVELKARYPDRERALRTCAALGARLIHTEVQTDTYFSVGVYRLKLRESSLGHHWLVGYSRPDAAGSRKSSYRLEPVPDPAEKRRILAAALGVKAVVRKERTFFLLGPVRIHVDRVDGLGDCLEFEAVLSGDYGEAEGHADLGRLREAFGIPEEDLLAGSYSDLVAAGA
jgi:predicted adenylyl cyclase CyaB